MKNEIQFEKDNHFNGKGIIDESFFVENNAQIRHWFGSAVKEFREVLEKYQKFLSNDGKILGDEKTLLIKELDDFLNCLIALYHFTDKEIDKNTFKIELANYEFRFNVSIKRNTWTGYGFYPDNFMKALLDFNKYYFKILSKDFQNLVNAFKNFPIGKEEDIPDDLEREIKNLTAILIYHILKVRFQIEKCMIND